MVKTQYVSGCCLHAHSVDASPGRPPHMQEKVLPVSSSEVVGIMLSDVQPAGSCWVPSSKALAGQASTVVHTAMQAFCI